LATGRHPFEGDELTSIMHRHVHEAPRPVGELNPQLTPFFEEVVGQLLAKEPSARFPTAEELHGVLTEGEQSAWWADQARTIREETRQPLRRIRIPRETALHGREEERASLGTAFDTAEAGDGRVVLLEGEDGIGKTRLVDELAGRLTREGRDLHFLFGEFPPGGAATAASALATAFREHFGEQDLTQVLNRYLPTTPLLVPALAALLRGEPPPSGVEPLTRESLQTLIVSATRALAAEKPVLILTDDLHYAPEEGRALFASLALAVPGHRILLVGTARPGLPEDWASGIERLEQTSRLTLPRLGPKDLGRLLVDAFRSDRLAEELGWQIARKSDGNPLFVFEIIRGLREGRLITQSDNGTWIRTQLIREIQIPSSVLDLIHARVAELDEDEKELLDVASCIGFEFDPLLAADALGLDQIPAMKRLAHVERHHRLVRAKGRSFVFDHHQVREAFYNGLPELLREPYHAALAVALERREGAPEKDPGDLDGSLAVDLSRHYLLGARPEPAGRYLGAALDHMERGYQNAALIGLVDLALSAEGLLEGVERAQVLLRKAGRLGVLGRREEERAALDQALELGHAAREPSLCARILRLLGMHLLGVHAREEAGARLAEALGLARQAGDLEEEGVVLLHLGAAFKDLGSLEEARQHYERAIGILREVGDAKNEVLALGRL
ncbi:MAG: ATP-binding protein, partial [Planctomycetota bacterium]